MRWRRWQSGRDSGAHVKDRTRPSKSKASSATEVDRVTRMVRERLKESEAVARLDFHVERVEKGRAIFLLEVQPKHKQLHGVVHGGVLATLADTTAAIACYTVVSEGVEIATIEMKINFLEPVPGGTIRAEGRVLRAGRNFVVAECDIRNEGGSLAAKALLTFGAAAGFSLARSLQDRWVCGSLVFPNSGALEQRVPARMDRRVN